jgi:hypothetical protein
MVSSAAAAHGQVQWLCLCGLDLPDDADTCPLVGGSTTRAWGGAVELQLWLNPINPRR